MKTIDWIAIFGALAWTPHVIACLKRILTKPEVRVIVSKRCEIGFTTFGTIFNIRLALSVKHHDTVISDLKVKVVHESGEEKIFEWQGLKQQISTMTTPDGGIMPNEKEHSVLAIKLNQNQIEERSVQCQEAVFIKEKYNLETIVLKKIIYLRSKGKYNELTFLESQEMSDLYKYIKQSFSWKPGEYNVIIQLESPENIKLIDNQYLFSLSSLDIEQLEENKEYIKTAYEPLKDDKSNEIKWNWRNPQLIKINK